MVATAFLVCSHLGNVVMMELMVEGDRTADLTNAISGYLRRKGPRGVAVIRRWVRMQERLSVDRSGLSREAKAEARTLLGR